MEEPRYTPQDIIEGQLDVREAPAPVFEPPHHVVEAIKERITHSRVVFEARQHIKKKFGSPDANGR